MPDIAPWHAWTLVALVIACVAALLLLALLVEV